MKVKEIEQWSPEKSISLYGIDSWGGEYFGVNPEGHVTVSPNGQTGAKIDLHELVQAVIDREIEVPVLFRFNGILRHRVKAIHQAFKNAIQEHNYTGDYVPAYPIKVNQQRHVVDVLRQMNDGITISLEVGSKPELIAVLALHDNPKALLLCNGYKDREYIELALMSKKVGRRPVIIIEKYSELNLIIEVAEKLGVEAEIGFRLRLAGKGAGRWERSGGDRAKFGLTIGEVVECIEELKKIDKLSIVRLLHFHIGSQLTAISSLRAALKEACQVYVQLRRDCPELDHLDVGGGLGVDYDGSKTTFPSSMNYTVEEYARDVVWVIDETCQQHKVPHPNIVTEAGRATVAHHSVLVFNTLGLANTFSKPCNGQEVLKQAEHKTVKTLAQLLIDLTPKSSQESLHDAMGLRSDLLEQFNLGLVTIKDRALGDDCYWALLSQISKNSQNLHYIPEDLERLPSMLTDTYFCNLSIFQSLPDNWAIQQIFPIMPIHRLDEEPTASVVIADITCDSDGTIDRFADLKDVKRYLPAHTLKPNEPYYFGAFLVGAYQEILGDLHNLFGDTNAVHVEVDESGEMEFTSVVLGDTVSEVLKYVQYDREDLCERWRTVVEQAVSRRAITPTESAEIYRKYTNSFRGYTYLESSNPV
jgi:arginine decarboxylase